jgi:hypothetical protein
MLDSIHRAPLDVSVSVVGLAAAEDAQASMRKLTNISAQALEPALNTLAKERNQQLVYRSEVVGDLPTRGVSGDLTENEALSQLLEGTG